MLFQLRPITVPGRRQAGKKRLLKKGGGGPGQVRGDAQLLPGLLPLSCWRRGDNGTVPWRTGVMVRDRCTGVNGMVPWCTGVSGTLTWCTGVCVGG